MRKYFREVNFDDVADNCSDIVEAAPKEDREIVAFWKDLMRQYTKQVNRSFYVSAKQLTNEFTCFDYLPEAIIGILRKSNAYCASSKLFKKEKEADKTDEANQSGLVSGLYNTVTSYMPSLWGSSETPADDTTLHEDEFVDVAAIDTMKHDLQVRLADKVMSEHDMRLAIQDYLKQQDFSHEMREVDAVLGYMSRTRELAKGTVATTGKVYYKMARLSETFESAELPKADLAQEELSVLIEQLKDNFKLKSQKVTDLASQALAMGKSGQKELAYKLLRQKKQVQRSLEADLDKQLKLEEVLFTLRQGKSDVEMIKSLRLARDAGQE